MKIEQVDGGRRGARRDDPRAAAAADRGAHAADARAARRTSSRTRRCSSRATTTARILGTLTLVLYRVSSGLKGRIEDVIVDESARGQGVGEALIARGDAPAPTRPGVLMLELTSMPYRQSANRLYKRLGFVRKPTNVYVWWPR